MLNIDGQWVLKTDLVIFIANFYSLTWVLESCFNNFKFSYLEKLVKLCLDIVHSLDTVFLDASNIIPKLYNDIFYSEVILQYLRNNFIIFGLNLALWKSFGYNEVSDSNNCKMGNDSGTLLLLFSYKCLKLCNKILYIL